MHPSFVRSFQDDRDRSIRARARSRRSTDPASVARPARSRSRIVRRAIGSSMVRIGSRIAADPTQVPARSS